MTIIIFGCSKPENIVNPSNPPSSTQIAEKKEVETIWSKYYGGNNPDIAFCSLITADKKILIAGISENYSPSGNKESTSRGGENCWVIQIDGDGKKIFDKSFDLTSRIEILDGANLKVLATADNGFVLASSTDTRVVLLKIDALGNELWKFESDYLSEAFDINLTDISQNANGDIFILGSTGRHDDYGYLPFDVLISLDNNGVKKWSKTFYGNNSINSKSIYIKGESVYIFSENQKVNFYEDSPIEKNREPIEIWLKKVDFTGRLEETIILFKGAEDNDISLLGSSISGENFNIVVGNKNGSTINKVSLQGNIIFKQDFLGTKIITNNTFPLINNSIIITGFTNEEKSNIWIYGADSNYKIKWAKSYGGNEIDRLINILEKDGFIYLIVKSNSFPITGNKMAGYFENYDYGVIKIKIL